MKLFNRKWSNDGGTVTPLPPIATPNIVQQIIAREGQRPSYPSRENVVAAQSEITRLNTLIADTNKSIDHWTQKRNDAEASKNNCPKLFFGGIDTNTDCYRAREGDKNDANSKLDTLISTKNTATTDLATAQAKYNAAIAQYNDNIEIYTIADEIWMTKLNEFIDATSRTTVALNESNPELVRAKIEAESEARIAQIQADAAKSQRQLQSDQIANEAAAEAAKSKNKKLIIALVGSVFILGVIATGVVMFVKEK